jgi:hypothetical protein
MFAFWMSGIEDRPERSGEICVAEIFGSDVMSHRALVGIGLHQFRDLHLTEEFSAISLPIDVTEDHTYGVDWRPSGLHFTIDSEVVRTSQQAPDYPMQLMIGVCDFPDRRGPDDLVPHVVVSRVRGQALTSTA